MCARRLQVGIQYAQRAAALRERRVRTQDPPDRPRLQDRAKRLAFSPETWIIRAVAPQVVSCNIGYLAQSEHPRYTQFTTLALHKTASRLSAGVKNLKSEIKKIL